MTIEVLNKKQIEVSENKEVTFKCKFCGKTKPLDEMRFPKGFSPTIVACRDCEKMMQ